MSGNARAKHAAMWEGPFEFYVWLDSDAIVWGDFTPQVRTDVDFQIFWSDIDIPADATEIPPWLPHFQFDPQKLRKFDPEFDWRGKAYFSAGVFACKRDVIPFEKWIEAELWGEETPGLFGDFSDQPLLNYFVHSMTQRGEIKSAMSDLQHIWAHHGKEELMKDCSGRRVAFSEGDSPSARGSFLWTQAIPVLSGYLLATFHYCSLGASSQARITISELG